MARTTFSGPVASGDGFISVAATSGKTLTIQAPAALTADTTLTFPDGAGSNGQQLTTNGTGVLSWSSAGGTGTVTSVAATAGTGISITGSPITGAGTLGITNTAPDQVVVLTGAGSTTISGTYPSFTITSSAGDVVGPASSTDNAITRYDSTTGKLLQNSLVTISDAGAIVAPEAGSVIPFYFANQAAFPSAATYHGAVAHSHADGAMYYAHGGVWTLLYSTSNLALTATAVVDLQAVGNAINTTGKYTGKMVVVLASGLIFTATGAAAADVWRASDGTTVATPV